MSEQLGEPEGSTLSEVTLPLAARLTNFVGAARQRFGMGPMPLSVEGLRRVAERQTGLSDWGPAESFAAGVEVLLESARDEVSLTPFGRAVLREDCLRVLGNQLLLQSLMARRPEIQDRPVERPIVIAGFFRTGTTLVQRLLGCDPGLRSLALWEALRPVAGAGREGRDPRERLRQALPLVRLLRTIIPPQIHPISEAAPEESVFLLGNTLNAIYHWAFFSGPSFLEWWLTSDKSRQLQYLRSQLQCLQGKEAGGAWVLKSGEHLLHLRELLEVFPDARIVWTHRDPCEFVPSFCSLVSTPRSALHAPPLDVEILGSECARIAETGIRRGTQTLDQRDDVDCLHLSFPDLVRDPLGCVGRIYTAFGIDRPADVESRQRKWLEENPPGKHGRHHYSLGQFGLDPASLRHRFADYTERFLTD